MTRQSDKCDACGLARGFHGATLAEPGDPQCVRFVPREGMRALTVRQPWASLIASGEKRVETRPMRTKHRGPMAIHAGLSWGPAQRALASRLGVEVAPVGAVVCVVNVVDCVRMTPDTIEQASERERELGDWRPGRWAWHLENPRPLSALVPAKGRLGVWRLGPEESEAIAAQIAGGEA